MAGKTIDYNNPPISAFDLDYEENRGFVFSLMVWLVRNYGKSVRIPWSEIKNIWGFETSYIQYASDEQNITLFVVNRETSLQ